MKEKKIFDAITEVDEELVEEARTATLQAHIRPWKRWAAIAACIALVAGIGGPLLLRMNFSVPGGNSGSGGHGEGSAFMSYAGPVFPLTLSEAVDDLNAVREINFDFSPYTPREEEHTTSSGEMRTYTRWDSEIIVTDAYTLENDSEQELEISAIYPFAGSIRKLGNITPSVMVDGSEVQTVLHAGPYSGSFKGATGEDSEEEGNLNLADIQSWEGYGALLPSGEYRERSFDEFTQLNQKVIVYEFSEATADYEEAVNPSLNIEFSLDYDKTWIFTYGFNGGSMDLANNYRANNFSVPQESNSDYNMPRYLIVVGEDIKDYVIQGYENGGCAEGEEMDSVTASVKRYETTLREALWNAMQQYTRYYENEEENFDKDAISDEMRYGLAVEMLLDDGVLSENVMRRYDLGMLEDVFSETQNMERVFYLSFDLTVPAGESLTVTANMIKENSFDYYGSGNDNQDIDGYDMVTRLGSNIEFTEQLASIQDHALIEIIRQNFGFDLENGIRSVTLDPVEEHYYIEVTPKYDE